MPLEVQVLRNGEPVNHIWDGFTLSCIYTAAIKEGAPDTPITKNDGSDSTFGELEDGQYIDFSWEPIYYLDIDCPLIKRGKQQLLRTHKFPYNDERTVTLKAGDVLHAWRSSK